MYKTGELAKMANVSIRTIRYYDSIGLLAPSAYSVSGHRLYTEKDFSKLQRILALKYLGLSLEEVMNVEAGGFEKDHVVKILELQKQILRNKLYHIKNAIAFIEETKTSVVDECVVDWSEITDFVQVAKEDTILRQRLIDRSSLMAEIEFVEQLNPNKNWYEWVFAQLDLPASARVLEIGCGEGSLWYKNKQHVPPALQATLTEVTYDLLSGAKQNLGKDFAHFEFEVMPFDVLTFDDESFDVVIANHVLFFSKNAREILAQIKRILKKGGRFYCSTITAEHLKELEELLSKYDKKLHLGKAKQLQNFGDEQANLLLTEQFDTVTSAHYVDELVINHPDMLLNYIYSIPGEMLAIASNRRKEFESYIEKAISAAQLNFKVANCHVLFSCTKG